MKVASVVLHYRFWPGVRTTLDALVTQTRPPDAVVVVDNHSNDGSLPKLRHAYPHLEVIEADQNRGYGGGMNLGIARLLAVGTDAILLLTHECRLDPGALAALVGRLEEDPTVGVVGPLLGELDRPHAVFSGGGQIDRRTWKTAHLRTPELMDGWTGRSAHQVEWVDGAAVLLRADALKAGGRLDEDYFMYFEETEYQLKLRELGWSVECVPAARAWQRSGGKPPYLWTRNRLRFVARTAPRRLLMREILRLVRSLTRRWIRPGSESERAIARARWKALSHFLTGRRGPGPLMQLNPSSMAIRNRDGP